MSSDTVNKCIVHSAQRKVNSAQCLEHYECTVLVEARQHAVGYECAVLKPVGTILEFTLGFITDGAMDEQDTEVEEVAVGQDVREERRQRPEQREQQLGDVVKVTRYSPPSAS